MVNTLTAAELKRRGVAAIEEGLKRGPVRIIKHNRPSAVVLAEQDYQKLLAASGQSEQGMTALEWLLSHPAQGSLSKREIDERMREERAW